MTDYADFKGTFTPHYEFAKPSGEDNVSIDVLNDNMDKLDGILYDIYSRLSPTPPQQFELVRADGEPVVAEGIELARNFDSTATMAVGDTYTVTLNSPNEQEQTTETVTIMDFSQMCEGAYGFMVLGGIFAVMFNAYATPSGDNLAFTPKDNSIVAVGGGSWTSVVAIPE